MLSALDGVAETGRGSVRVRLDPDMVGLATSVRQPIELDYWYGPRFDDNLASIPTGVTRHEASEREKHFFAISATEFWWHSRDGQHSLEAEELRELPTVGAGREVFGCRYVHSIVEEASGRIVHLDGAIRAYTEDKMIERLEVPITTAGRRSDYTKLWRVDGDIPLATWKSLIHGYYRDNPLVAEYLQGDRQPESNAEPPEGSPPQPEPSPIAALVPHSVAPGRSARLLLSFHDLPALALDAAPAVVPLEDLVADDRTQTVVDADVSELQKALRRGGGDLNVPEGAMRLAFEDFYLTFPLVRHASAQQVTATVAALEAILGAWARTNNDDRVVAFSLGAPLGDQELRVSVFGHVKDLGACLPLVRSLFACTDQEAVARWVDSAVALISAHGADETIGTFDRLITPSGTYRMMRTILQPGTFHLMEVQGQLKFQLALPNDKQALVSAVQTGALRPIFARLIRASTCSRCAGDYIACDCSNYLDADVSQRCDDFEIAYVFWTDRPADGPE